MECDVLEKYWETLKVWVKQTWSKLDERDLELIGGKYEELYQKLRERYGYTNAETIDEIRRFSERMTANLAEELTNGELKQKM